MRMWVILFFVYLQVLSGGSLVISDVTFADQQQYICEASNTAGSGIAVVSLTVLGVFVCVCMCMCARCVCVHVCVCTCCKCMCMC